MPAKGQRSGHFINCEYCGKQVYQTNTQYNRAKHHYCSNFCQKKCEHDRLYENRKCEICGKEFSVKKTSKQRFCSPLCQSEWQKTLTGKLSSHYKRVEMACEVCGKKYDVRKYKVGTQHNFCSNECRRFWYSTEFSQSEEWRDISKKRAVRILENKQIDTNTKPQVIINDLLNKMNISYINEKGFKYYAVDNYLDEYNLVIEVMGDFWHCNPLKYNNPTHQEIHRKRIPRDKAKHTYIKNIHNIEILYLWESDIYDNIDLCELLIKEYIDNHGILPNYHSFNYHIEDNHLILNDNLVILYQDIKNIVNA